MRGMCFVRNGGRQAQPSPPTVFQLDPELDEASNWKFDFRQQQLHRTIINTFHTFSSISILRQLRLPNLSILQHTFNRIIHHRLHALQEARGYTVRCNQTRNCNPYIFPRPLTPWHYSWSVSVGGQLWANVGCVFVVVYGREYGYADNPSQCTAEMETVAAVSIRKEGMESARAVTGIVVVTAVPTPKSVENAYAQLSHSDVTRPINPSNCQSLSSTSEGRTYP